MRAAPPVQALSCSAGRWQSVQQVLYASTAAVSSYWAGSHLVGGGPWLALASLALGLGGAAAAVRGTALPPRQLAWDGAVWALHSSQDGWRPGQVMLMLDLGTWMLLRFMPTPPHGARRAAAQWLPLSARDAAGSWPALRVALYARQAAGDSPAVPQRPFDAA
jgi:hypothetical protein